MCQCPWRLGRCLIGMLLMTLALCVAMPGHGELATGERHSRQSPTMVDEG